MVFPTMCVKLRAGVVKSITINANGTTTIAFENRSFCAITVYCVLEIREFVCAVMRRR